MVDAKSCSLAFVTGLLASSCFCWAFIFRAAFGLNFLCTFESQLYYYSPLLLQVLILLAALIKFKSFKNVAIPTLAPISMAFALFTLYLFTLFPKTDKAAPAVPLMFLITLLCTAIIFPIIYSAVYLCNAVVQSYFSAGMFSGIMIYYGVLFYNIFGNLGAFIPFCAYLGFGTYAFETLKKNCSFQEGLFACRAIYVFDSDKYVKYGLLKILSSIYKELLAIFVTVAAMCVITACLHVSTPHFIGLSTYNYIFLVGLFFCAETSLDSFIAYAICLIFTGCFSILLFTLNIPHAVACGIIVSMYVAYFSALNCLIKIMRRTLKRGINTPCFTLVIVCLCNIALSCVFLILNKCQV